MTLIILLIALCAFLGGIAFAVLGWLESKEPFEQRKFLASVLRSFIGAWGVAYLFDYGNIQIPFAYILAFIAGLAVDEGIKRILGIAQAFWQRPSG